MLYPLTAPQRNIWNVQKYYEGTIIANIGGLFTFTLKYDYEALNNALNQVIKNNDAFRLRFFEENGHPCQQVAEYIPERIAEYDMRGKSRAEIDAHFSAIMHEPFKIVNAPQYRIGAVRLNNGRVGALVCVTHLICDAWSFTIIAREIIKYYEIELAQLIDTHRIEAVNVEYSAKSTEITCQPSFLMNISTEEDYLRSTRYFKDKSYWDAAFEQKPLLCRIKDTSKNRNSEAGRFTSLLNGVFCHELNNFCHVQGVTPAVFFEAALIAYLHRINDFAPTVTIGSLTLNRSSHIEKKTVGMFVATLPLAVPVPNGCSMSELCRSIRQKHMEVFRHQKYPLDHILRSVRQHHGDISGLWEVMVSYQNARMELPGKEVSADWLSNGHSEATLCLHIEDIGNAGGYKLHLDYQKAVLSEAETAMLCERLLHIMRQTMGNSAVTVDELEIVAPDEYARVIRGFNSTAVDYSCGKLVPGMFEEWAAKEPGRQAVIAADKNLTYGQLHLEAGRIASALLERGVKIGGFIAVMLPRKSFLLSSILGVLKSGAAFLPLDPDTPSERVNYIVNDCKAEFLLTTRDFAALHEFKCELLFADEIVSEERPAASESAAASTAAVVAEAAAFATNPNLMPEAEDLAYCIYTSGSTGLPKGTLIAHKNLRNYINFCKSAYGYTRYVMPLFTDLGADLTITSIFLPITTGGTVTIVDGDMPSRLRQCVRSDFNVVKMTPTQFELMTLLENMGKIRGLIVGGEKITPAFLDKIGPDIALYDEYGPTETTVGSSLKVYAPRKASQPASADSQFAPYGLHEQDGFSRRDAAVAPRYGIGNYDITIGTPIDNTRIYILDKNLRPLPIGIYGELCIAGDGVGRGYLNRPELTAEKFVDNPFAPGERMYKTGDLARWRGDGQIEYLGRMDNQVKIRGLRIELGEIESALSAFPGVRQAAVADKKDDSGRQYLCAYYVADAELDVGAARRELGKKLPHYMIPHFFTRMESFPFTGSGKINRKSLPAPDLGKAHSQAEFVAPANEREKALARLFETVLGVSPVGMGDSFFDLGGDSLKAIEMVARANNAGFRFKLQNIFEHPTPAELSRFSKKSDNARTGYTAADFTKFEPLLAGNRIASSPAPYAPVGNLFITGATGFLGAHILDEYLQTETGTAFCLVRGKNAKDAARRLHGILAYYFGDKYAGCKRISVVYGDITEAVTCAAEIGTVIHAAANVRHYGRYEHFHEVNVRGTENMIAFAQSKGARLHHISTISVCGSGFAGEGGESGGSETVADAPVAPGAPFTEGSLFIGQALDNVYVRSKFEAEVAVLEARLNGLEADIIRVGNLSNRHSDARFQPNFAENATLSRLKAIIEFGFAPESLLPLELEFSPVDCAAKAIMALARHDSGLCIWHLFNDKPVAFANMLQMLRQMHVNIKVVSDDDFAAQMRKAEESGNRSLYETFVTDFDDKKRLVYHNGINIQNSATVVRMNKLGFSWPEADFSYLKRYVEYFKANGCLAI